MTLLRLLLATTMLGGCITRDVSKIDPETAREVGHVFPASPNRKLDILFVVDDSGSMSQEQTSLGANFQRFIDVLAGIEGGLPDVHIGVVSTDVGTGAFPNGQCDASGDDGVLLAGDGSCGVSGRFLVNVADDDGGRTRNYAGSLQQTFACMATLGAEGCGLEQPLAAMQRALDGSRPQNEGFLRDDAYLAVVFLTDEDDCSASDDALFDEGNDVLGPISLRCAEYGILCDGERIERAEGAYENCVPWADSPYLEDPASYVEFLLARKPGRPKNVLVAGIVGDPDHFEVWTNPDNPRLEPAPSCTSSNGTAAPAIRLGWFLDAFSDRTTTVSICNPDLSAGLTDIASRFRYVFELPCLDAGVDPTDVDAGAPGLQLDCAVTDVRWDNQGAVAHEEVIARCPLDAAGGVASGGRRPCWWVEEAAECRPESSGLALHVERAEPPPPGTDVVVRCRGE